MEENQEDQNGGKEWQHTWRTFFMGLLSQRVAQSAAVNPGAPIGRPYGRPSSCPSLFYWGGIR